jgi:hypothetical protein
VESDESIKEIYDLIDNGKFAEAKAKAKKTDMKPSTYDGILTKIRSIQDHWESKATTEQKFRYSQGKAMLSTALGIIEGQLVEQIDPVTKVVFDQALRDFNSRSIALGGKEDSFELANKLIPQYQDLLIDKHQVASENYQKMLRFKTPAELEAARNSKQISQREYELQKDLAMRYFDARRKEDEARAQRANTGKAKK